ncbi:glycosyltransferase [Pelosinus sp. sgz500959]|uniref:tetratricopeptide repeat-containing glycosyltransferase family 2 protein n=1 Tax=Pelosinus sp. sgz500959 TaxID=3242472 RepID=UPI0036701FC8
MTLQRISLAMIVRNEGSRLAHCLDSVKDAVDEIVIVDTGSSDDTMEVARQYTENVYSYQWKDDFAAARNYALQQTTSEWILSLDADEQLHMEPDDLRSLLNTSAYSAFCLPLCALKPLTNNHQYDRFMVLRLFQRQYRFKGVIHEHVSIDDPSTVGYASHPIIWHTPVSLAERHRRRGRNIAMLKKTICTQNPIDPHLLYYIGTEWFGVRRADLAIDAFKKALKEFSPEQIAFRSPTVRHLISCYKSVGKLDEAICLCLEESQHYPNYCDLFFEGGVLFELKKEYEVGMKWFKEAINSGPPPLPFFHTDGTDSYLAYYHLGYCAEKLGLIKEAKHYYEQALHANKTYYYPLYQLVLLKLTQQTAAEVLDFLKERDELALPEVSEKMAELFWTAGFPDIGMQCLNNTISHPTTNLELLARCQLYSGEIALALQSIAQIRQNGIQTTVETIVDEITAFMLINRFNEARQGMWELWRRKDCRDTFRAVFCIYKKLCHNTLLPLSNPKSIGTLLDLQNRCLRVRAKKFQEQQCFATLLAAIKDILFNDKDTFERLISDLQEKEDNVKRSLDYTFTILRDFYR